MNFHFDPALIALAQVILIDLTLAGDNAILIGMTAAHVEPKERRKVIFWGLAAAVVLLIGLATVVMKLLTIIGLSLAGGILLLWVAWRFYRELAPGKEQKAAVKAFGDNHAHEPHQHYLNLRQAVIRIAIADLSMSLDNVLAVAGAAQGHTWVLIVGLTLSIALVGVAAVYVAKLMQRYPWISYLGLIIIVYVAARMIWEGAGQVANIF